MHQHRERLRLVHRRRCVQPQTYGGGFATVAGGYYNTASGYDSTVSGGRENTASGTAAAVPGGRNNRAGGTFSFAGGRFAFADHDGSFVWADGAYTSIKRSSVPDEFNVYASGGTRIFSNSQATAGVLLAPGSGSWTSASDRNSKEEVEPVDPSAVLEALAGIPISTWSYETQDSVRHMGPMAQDFWSAFELGLGDTTIDTVDADGVALAAIQGLNRKLQEHLAERDRRLAAQSAELDRLSPAVEELRRALADV